MVKLVRGVLAAAAVVVLVSALQAQQQQQRQRGGRGFGGVGGFGGPGGSSLGLLSQESVQKELKLSDDQVKALTAIREKQRGGFADLRNLSREERQAKLQERAKETEKAVNDILKPEQSKRLKQISLQLRGVQAVNDPEVAAALKITDEQKEKIKTIREDSAKEMRELFQPGGNREEAFKKMADLRKTTNEKLEAVLTSEQKAKLTELKGEPFKGEFRRPEGRRPGGQGQPGEGRPRGRRPRTTN